MIHLISAGKGLKLMLALAAPVVVVAWLHARILLGMPSPPKQRQSRDDAS